ncbi:hypothetical protein Prudu_004450 [Prunus dulcis]|uniref:MATE efflux family protein n=1 Tax=Prunus dulcis TaxID=3755 RepID=A0A4Y1QVH1_PRUDU|nr:hypothetical protein Prudu_004450 [Prunus dulcis]
MMLPFDFCSLEFWSYRILIIMTGSLEKATLAVDALTIWYKTSPSGLVRVANELGAGNWKATKFAAKVSMAESVFIGLCICVITIILHDKFACIFTSSTDLIQEVGQMSYLLAMAILLNSIQPVLTGIVVGTGLQAWVAYINLFCYYIIGLPLALVMGWIRHLGVSGIWGGMIFGGTAVQTVILGIVLIRHDWEKEAQKASQRAKKWITPNPDNQIEEHK